MSADEIVAMTGLLREQQRARALDNLAYSSDDSLPCFVCAAVADS